MPKLSKLNWVFIAELVLFVLIITGVVPRWFALILAGILIVYSFTASIEDATILFMRSIPLFLALPITATFDNFNTWRILSIIIFLRWAIHFTPTPPLSLKGGALPALLCSIAVVSVFVAPDKAVAIKRVIYFINLSLIPIVVYDLVRRVEGFSRRFIKNVIIPLAIVVVAGFVQLISTYFLDIYQFIEVWGRGIQCRQFGMEWCTIAIEKGNTWFAYNSFGQINLRMFSLFTDSHTFPVFILMTLASVFAYGAERLDFTSIKTASRVRARLLIVLIPLGFFAAILSNTRGIWLAGWVTALIGFASLFFLKNVIWKYVVIWLVAFLMLFALVYPVSATPQFHLYAGRATLSSRIHSILDFAETSNKLRIAIWKASIRSIAHHPFLGVGIGNFPVVLGQDINQAKAGSSAHNLYLHIAAELGIPALAIALLFLWFVLKKIYRSFYAASDKFHQLYFGALLIFVPWVLMYHMTDAALFDERAFLITLSVFALVLAYPHDTKILR